jgi:hypothetical protein
VLRYTYRSPASPSQSWPSEARWTGPRMGRLPAAPALVQQRGLPEVLCSGSVREGAPALEREGPIPAGSEEEPAEWIGLIIGAVAQPGPVSLERDPLRLPASPPAAAPARRRGRRKHALAVAPPPGAAGDHRRPSRAGGSSCGGRCPAARGPTARVPNLTGDTQATPEECLLLRVVLHVRVPPGAYPLPSRPP